jgi:hypothetical protein
MFSTSRCLWEGNRRVDRGVTRACESGNGWTGVADSNEYLGCVQPRNVL